MTSPVLATLSEPRYDAALESLAISRRDILSPYNRQFAEIRAEARAISLHSLMDELTLASNSLDVTQVYYLSDQIRGLLDLAAGSMPDEAVFTRELFPTEFGFLHLQTPVEIESYNPQHPEAGLRTGSLHAISWAMYREANEVALEKMRHSNHVYRIGGDSSGVMALTTGIREISPYPTHVMLCVWLVPYVDPTLPIPAGFHQGQRIPITLPVKWGETFGDATAVGSAVPESTKHSGRYTLGLLVSFLKFCMQKILEPEERTVGRAAFRALERQSKRKEPAHRTIRVIRLRQRVRRPGETDEESERRHIEWSHRWLVSGHWRHYTGAGGRKPQTIWVSPYLKGPEGRPLKQPTADKVYAVIR